MDELNGVHLREMRESDADAMFAIYGDVDTTAHLSFTPKNHEQCKAIVDSAIADQSAEPRTVHFLAIANKNDQMIGVTRLQALDDGRAEIGFAIERAHWRKGYGLAGLQLSLLMAFDELGYTSVQARRAEDNLASAALLFKAGFHDERRLKDSIVKNGVPEDRLMTIVTR